MLLLYNNDRRLLFENLSNRLVPNVNHNTFITLMSNHICKVLLEGSIDASNEENTSILDDVFKFTDSTTRFNTFEELVDTLTDK